jgi:hypothetical protein
MRQRSERPLTHHDILQRADDLIELQTLQSTGAAAQRGRAATETGRDGAVSGGEVQRRPEECQIRRACRCSVVAADVLIMLSCSFSSNRSTVRAGRDEDEEEGWKVRDCGCDMRKRRRTRWWTRVTTRETEQSNTDGTVTAGDERRRAEQQQETEQQRGEEDVSAASGPGAVTTSVTAALYFQSNSKSRRSAVSMLVFPYK